MSGGDSAYDASNRTLRDACLFSGVNSSYATEMSRIDWLMKEVLIPFVLALGIYGLLQYGLIGSGGPPMLAVH